ncbi:BCCT family transporter [Tomitella fengzijianii]|uniref:BCCT family transporter n=1 Tax=Tomitella fengzijianii TaxID=2597660 RepID=UPI0018EEEE41|nr:BCCT family transporter [Tomitella fengzijianii]
MRTIHDAWQGIRKPVFIPASLIIFGMIAFAVVYSGTAEDAFTSLKDGIADGVGWWYILSATGFVLFAAYCVFSRVGSIRLGRDDERPEFGVFSWFAMLFSAGMGIGLVFYGVAEPLSHYIIPPQSGGIEGGTDAAANQSMQLTMFHWGLHAWAIYVVVGLGLAYMTYRKGRPMSVRWLLEPLLGRKRIEGPIGHAIDVIAVVGTLFGIATSLGFGVQQISAGLEYLGWLTVDNPVKIIIIVVVTAMATLSVVSGVTKGLKWLSNINMVLAALLALFVLALGPTLFLAQAWVQNLGGYVQALPQMMLRTAPFSDDTWLADWTIFYWGWWMSWAPFVGMFIARISRGRTIREFIAGVILAPTVIASLWFTIFGDSGILRQRDDGDMLVDGAVDTNTTLFHMLDGLPLGVITSVLAIAVVVFFFVTSSDSGSLVIDMLSTGGDMNTPKITRVYWSVLEGLAAAILLVVGGAGSLTALQTASIATAVPFSIVLVLACVSMLKAFRFDLAHRPRYVHVSTPGGGGSTVLATSGAAGPDKPAQQSTPPGAGPEREPVGATPTGQSAESEHWWRRSKVSATFAGLSPSDRPAPEPQDDSLVVRVHEIPVSALEVDPETGAVGFDRSAGPSDPLGGEVFDTPEFAESAIGAEMRSNGNGNEGNGVGNGDGNENGDGGGAADPAPPD